MLEARHPPRPFLDTGNDLQSNDFTYVHMRRHENVKLVRL